MSARDELADLYERWRQLTLAEAEAIRLTRWAELEQHQLAKAKLQPVIAHAEEQLKAELPAGFVQREAIERQLQNVVDELIQLEQGNHDLLAAQRQTADDQRVNLERTGRNLRQLHRSYAPTLATAHWQSYS